MSKVEEVKECKKVELRTQKLKGLNTVTVEYIFSNSAVFSKKR